MILGLGVPSRAYLLAVLLIILFYISVLWTTLGTPVGQDIVRRAHDLQIISKISLRRESRPIPLLICRGWFRGPGWWQGGLVVALVQEVELLGPGVLSPLVSTPLGRRILGQSGAVWARAG